MSNKHLVLAVAAICLASAAAITTEAIAFDQARYTPASGSWLLTMTWTEPRDGGFTEIRRVDSEEDCQKLANLLIHIYDASATFKCQPNGRTL